jgi:hypothetical protein
MCQARKMGFTMRFFAVFLIVAAGCGKPPVTVSVRPPAAPFRQPQEAPSKPPVAVPAAVPAAAPAAEDTGDREGPQVVRLGETVRAGGLEITPQKVEYRMVPVLDVFDSDEKKEVGPHMVLTIAVKNITEGQVIQPFTLVEAIDSFGNTLQPPLSDHEIPQIGGAIEDGIKPGESAVVVEIMERAVENAKSYRWTCNTHCSNSQQADFAEWIVEFDNDDVVTSDP